MKICIITAMKLPIPAIKGGAIETIVENLINTNSKYNLLELDCYSISYDQTLKEKYFNSFNNIYYIKVNNIVILFQKIINLIEIITCKLFKRDIKVTNFIYKKISKLTTSKNYDYIIFEGGIYNCARYFLKSYRKDQLILHLHHKLERNLDEYFGKVICVSEFVKLKFHNISGLSNEKVKVLKNVVNKDLFDRQLSEEEKASVYAQVDLKNEKVVLFCGRLIKEKGIEELILAFRNLKNLNVKLIIIGSSNFGLKMQTKFEKYIFNLIRSDNRIKYLGFISNSELYKYYSISDIFVMPSNWDEAAGLVILEAKISGNYIITTKVGGIPEYIDENECVFIDNDSNFILNIQNALYTALNINDYKKQIKRKIQLNKTEYSIDYYYYQFVKILEDFYEKDNIERVKYE